MRDYVIETNGYYLVPGMTSKNIASNDNIKKEQITGSSVPTKYELSANYPNPFNPSTSIEYAVPNDGMVTLKVYDVLGREVANLVNEYMPSGRYKITWDASKMASGIYVYRMTAGKFTTSRKMLLMK